MTKPLLSALLLISCSVHAAIPVGNVTYVGGTNDFGYTQPLEDFRWNTVPSPALSGGVSGLADNGDGTGSFTIDAAAANPRLDFYNAPYAFEPTAFPYLRINYRSSASETLTFWPSPANPTNENSTATVAAPGFTETNGRFLSLAMTDPADATVIDPWDSNGLRIDPLPAGTGSGETFELDYVMVDSFPTLGIDEFDRDGLQWSVSNLTAVPTLGKLTGAAGSAVESRGISKSITITNHLYNALEIRVMRAGGSEGSMSLQWLTQSNEWFSAEWLPESDGQTYSYLIDLAKCTEWLENITTEIRIELFDSSAVNNGKGFEIDFIRLRRLPEIGGGLIHEKVNWGTMLNLRYEPDWDYVLSKTRYFRSVAGQASNNGWKSKVSACGKRNEFEVVIDGRQPWWKESVDTDGDGTNDYEWVARGTNGLPDIEAASEQFFQYIKDISATLNTYDADTSKRLHSIHPDNAISELIFPNPSQKLGGGFYEVASGGDTNLPIDQAALTNAQALAADCFVRMMQKLKADPDTRHVKVYCFNALHVWEWNDALTFRDHSNNVCNPGKLEHVLDLLLQKNAVAFPNSDSPLVGFSQDYPWQYYRARHSSRKKLNEYMDYAQSRGYRYAVTCKGRHWTTTVPNPPARNAYEAMWRYMRRMLQQGARPDEVHAYDWSDWYDGEYRKTLLSEHEDSDYTYMAALRRTLDQMSYGLPPARPTEVYAEFDGNDVVVSWQENQEFDILGYEIQRAPALNGTFTTLTPSPVTGSSYTDTTTVSNGTYYYRVIAVLEDSDTSVRSAGLPSLPAKAVGAATQVLAEDDFENQTNPGWFTHINTPSIVSNGGGYTLKVDYELNGNGANWLRYFTPSGSPVDLNPGDILTIEWQAKQSDYNMAPGNTYLRMALLDSHGERISTDTAYESPVFTNYTGYYIAFGDIKAFAHSTFGRRTDPNETLTDGSAYTGVQGVFDLNTIPTNTWTPTQRITMERRSDGWLVTTVLGGGGTNAAATTIQRVVDTEADQTFDTILLRYAGGDPGMEYFIDNFKVTLKTRALPTTPLEDWMKEYNITDPYADNDNDQFANYDEWIAGTDPTNITSYFLISDYADGALTVPGVASRMYVLNFSTNLNESFVPIQTNYTDSGFSGDLSLTDSVHNAMEEGFYKIEVSVP